MNIRLAGLAVAFAALSACETPIGTASGQPEFTVQNVDAACVRSTVLGGLVNEGYMVRTTTDAQIVAERPSLGGAAVFLGTTQDVRRVTITFIPMAGGVRLVANEALVANAGTGFENVTPVYPTQEMQARFAGNGSRVQAMCGR